MRYLRWLMVMTMWMEQAACRCPEVCKCSITSGSVKTEVNCHKRGLPVFPTDLPSDGWILKLGEDVAHERSSERHIDGSVHIKQACN